MFDHAKTVSLTAEWITAYETRRTVHRYPVNVNAVDVEQEDTEACPSPHEVQQEALNALKSTRASGNEAGLVVMATGLGKTWLAAFDTIKFDKVLFVAHREEILNQAMSTFRKIRPDSHFGLYSGGQHDRDVDVLFASVQTLGRQAHLSQFQPNEFTYIVVDEFHHAAAATYRRLIDYFEPKFLLGLTATPERTDGGDLLGLCGENLVYRCDVIDGIERQLLSTFRYFGVPDEINFANIPWRSGRFDPEQLEFAVATVKRASSALEQWKKRGQTRTLAFCVSKRHADFMANFFSKNGVNAVAVHSGASSAPRTQSLLDLENGSLHVVFAVDMFNEGVDVPSIDTVMMLRPTESKILWLQQFGRGLRRAQNKSHLTVIDYIGNHRAFLQVPMILLPGAGETPGQLNRALAKLEQGTLSLPAGCSVEYDLEAINILKQLSAIKGPGNQIAQWYRSFRELHGHRPTASEAFHVGYDPKKLRSSFGSWLGFVKSEGDLSVEEHSAYDAHKEFLDELEVTRMTKSYKMTLLLGMIAESKFPGAIGIISLCKQVKRISNKHPALRAEISKAVDGDTSLMQLMVDNPIKAWTGGRGTVGAPFF
ncbi:MAG: DEAD/DEAH box helicase, partial [Pseudomonadales bacterium]